MLAANSWWNIVNFRRELISALINDGHEVVVLSPPPPNPEDIARLPGVTWIPIEIDGEGMSPIADLKLAFRYWRALRRLRPAAYLGFTAKPNIYGSIAARLAGVPAIANLTGLGTGFLRGRILEAMVTRLYKLALRRAHRVFFHNDDDLALFYERGIVRREQSVVLPGSGVDLERFSPRDATVSGDGMSFLLPSRLMWEKGLREFIDAARQIKSRRPDLRFLLLGAPASPGRGPDEAELQGWAAEGLVEILGSRDDVRPVIAASDCVVLPSYREGMPRVLLEAAAMGKPVIATDVPGCRQALVDGRTGLLCAVRSGSSLAEAMNRMIELGPNRLQGMGAEGRRLAEERFGIDNVIAAYRDALASLSQPAMSADQAGSSSGSTSSSIGRSI